MPVSIDIDQQEASPFQQEPRLIGFYHWNRSVRTMHQHENCIELNFMLSGNGTHIVGNEICHTQPGDIIVYDSKIMHDESLMLDSLTDACCIAVTGLQRPGARPNALLPPGTHPCIPCQSIAEELRTLYHIIEHSLAKPHGYPAANAAAQTIVHLVWQQISKRAVKAAEPENLLVEHARSYIEEHYAEDLSIRDIAQHFHASRDYISHAFKHTTNYAPLQYLRRWRIGKAQTLLIDTDLPLTEIALRVGFDDSNYFSRVFRQIIGMPPGTFRRACEPPNRAGQQIRAPNKKDCFMRSSLFLTSCCSGQILCRLYWQ